MAAARYLPLYAGISNYPAEQHRQAVAILRELGTPVLLHQARYSIAARSRPGRERWVLPDEAGSGATGERGQRLIGMRSWFARLRNLCRRDRIYPPVSMPTGVGVD
ncbi:hypothetical protein GCM10017778_46750 [Streptomyces vinaceus]|nr:hypothetical protein GCM10017778_46750 [Streptomyces vinaceus]